ncbi:putative necrosis-inducing factor-domain-containing protein [Cercophora newfieldiana]|uniref:Necrosis-inducing factor-domain-containing protein n=1 Tax=Cercophora newfieldiana TaxID=92897 RepID=A0AA39YC70_9PEZI|nr:putative necrosis-inducing factor-domain-containing protein [Cercophora newfieldiana]
MELLRSILLAVFLALAGLTTAAPAGDIGPAVQTTSPSTASNTTSRLTKRNRWCSPSSEYVDQTSEGSPKVFDCRQLAHNVRGDGDWMLRPQQYQRTIAKFNTCAVGVTILDHPHRAVFVGNEDVQDFVFESIDRFSWNGLIGAKGKFNCMFSRSNWENHVEWAVYHNW